MESWSENTISSLQEFSEQAQLAEEYLEKIELGRERECPPLEETCSELMRFIVPGNMESERLLGTGNIEMFVDNIQVARSRQTAAKFNVIPIEPMLHVAEMLRKQGRDMEARRIMNVYNFVLAMRRWYRKVWFGDGGFVKLSLELDKID